MVVGVMTVTAYLPSSMQLKDKRSIVKSVIAKVKHTFNASAAEVGLLDERARTMLGFSVVSNETGHADSILSYLENFLDQDPRMEIETVNSELIHF